ncbi:MAG: putative PEP-binding protein [Caldilineaceae bacterium]
MRTRSASFAANFSSWPAAPPDEATQLAAYRAAAAALNGGNWWCVRWTRADKPIPYLAIEAEENPFLGLRGIRFSLAERSLLHVQLRPCCGPRPTIRWPSCFPWSAHWTNCARRALVGAARRTLVRTVCRGRAPLGVMIETPAAVLLAPALAREVDFSASAPMTCSIPDGGRPQQSPGGRAGRTGAAAAAPRRGCRGAGGPRRRHLGGHLRRTGRRSRLTPLLLGLGIDEVSMNAAAIPAVKAAVAP